MSEFEEFDLNEFFSTIAPPDDLLSPPTFPAYLEPSVPWTDGAPNLNDNVFYGAIEFPGSFQADNDVPMSMDQAPRPTQYTATETVGDGPSTLFLQPSNYPTFLVQSSDERISDPTYESAFPSSCVSGEETVPLHHTEPRQAGNTSSSIAQFMPEGFEGQVTESQVSVPPVEEAPISSTATPQKRKAFGPSREYDLPPRKKGGRRGKMTQAEQESRKRTEKLGTCITCRRRGKKCNGEVPCSFCLQKLGPKLSKQPCTKATFMDIVEHNPCFEFSTLYQAQVIKTAHNMFFLKQIVTVMTLAQGKYLLELIPDMPLHAGVLTKWSFATRLFSSFAENLASTDIKVPPPLVPLIRKAPAELKRLLEADGVLPYVFGPSGSHDARTIFKKLLFCTCRYGMFRVYDSTGKLCDMSGDEDVRNAAQLLDWLVIRHLEIDIFCYLQKSVNTLNDLSISDLYDLIVSLVGLVEVLSGYWERAVKFSPEVESLDQEILRSWIDRHQRLFMALFVYSSIAISRLPPWSNSGGEPEIKFLFNFSSREFGDMFSDFESFKSKLEVKEKETTKPPDRLELRIKIFKEFNPNLDENFDDELWQGFFEYPKNFQSCLVDREFEEVDLLYMDGLISATMSGNFDEVRLSKFYSLANVDWELAIKRLSLGHFDAYNLNDMFSLHLINILKTRLHLTQRSSVLKEAYAMDRRILGDVVQFIESLDDELLKENPASCQKRRNLMLLSIREGLRWLELKELIGGEEIYLLGNPFDSLAPEDLLPLAEIPWTVKHGEEEDFDRLKKMLVSSQFWVQETCVQLRGIVDWIMKAIIACKSDKDTAANLSSLIQRKVKSTFGDGILKDPAIITRFMRRLTLIVRAKRNEQGGVIRAYYNPSVHESEEEDEDREDKDENTMASLIKSIQSLLRGSSNAPS